MTGEEIRALGEAVGWPLAVAIFMTIVLAKNGFFKVVMRDNSRDDLEEIKQDVRSLWKQNAAKKDALADLSTRVAVLEDRSQRSER